VLEVRHGGGVHCGAQGAHCRGTLGSRDEHHWRSCHHHCRANDSDRVARVARPSCRGTHAKGRTTQAPRV